MNINTKVRKWLNRLIQFSLIAFVLIFLYKKLFFKSHLEAFIDLFHASLYSAKFWMLVSMVFILMLLNWSIETIKWKALVSKFEKIGFIKAFKGVWAGTAISLFAPNRSGDLIGRAFILRKAKPLYGVMSAIVASFSQLMVTLVAGIFGVLALSLLNILDLNTFNNWILYLLILIVLLTALMLIFYFRIHYFSSWINRFDNRFFRWLSPVSQALNEYSQKDLWRTFLLSALRYLVFNIQFYLLLLAFGMEINLFHSLMITSSVYLITAIIPTVALSELGLRGSLSIWLFAAYCSMYACMYDNAEAISFSAAGLLWLINLALPSLLGSVFILELKFFRRK